MASKWFDGHPHLPIQALDLKSHPWSRYLSLFWPDKYHDFLIKSSARSYRGTVLWAYMCTIQTTLLHHDAILKNYISKFLPKDLLLNGTLDDHTFLNAATLKHILIVKFFVDSKWVKVETLLFVKYIVSLRSVQLHVHLAPSGSTMGGLPRHGILL